MNNHFPDVRKVIEAGKGALHEIADVALTRYACYLIALATPLYEGGTDITSIKELLGHTNIRTTMIYTHVSKKHLSKIQSPLDKLL